MIPGPCIKIQGRNTFHKRPFNTSLAFPFRMRKHLPNAVRSPGLTVFQQLGGANTYLNTCRLPRTGYSWEKVIKNVASLPSSDVVETNGFLTQLRQFVNIDGPLHGGEDVSTFKKRTPQAWFNPAVLRPQATRARHSSPPQTTVRTRLTYMSMPWRWPGTVLHYHILCPLALIPCPYPVELEIQILNWRPRSWYHQHHSTKPLQTA